MLVILHKERDTGAGLKLTNTVAANIIKAVLLPSSRISRYLPSLGNQKIHTPKKIFRLLFSLQGQLVARSQFSVDTLSKSRLLLAIVFKKDALLDPASLHHWPAFAIHSSHTSPVYTCSRTHDEPDISPDRRLLRPTLRHEICLVCHYIPRRHSASIRQWLRM